MVRRGGGSWLILVKGKINSNRIINKKNEIKYKKKKNCIYLKGRVRVDFFLWKVMHEVYGTWWNL